MYTAHFSLFSARSKLPVSDQVNFEAWSKCRFLGTHCAVYSLPPYSIFTHSPSCIVYIYTPPPVWYIYTPPYLFQFFSMKGSRDKDPVNFVSLGIGQNWLPGQFCSSWAGQNWPFPAADGQNWPDGKFWLMPRWTKCAVFCISTTLHWKKMKL